MEESSVVDLMEMNEYFMDDWDLNSSLYGESIDHDTEPNQKKKSWDQNEVIGDKRQGFELVCERPTKQMKSNNNNNNSSSSPSSSSSSPSLSSQVISFGDCNKASPAIDAMNFSDIIDMEQLRQGMSSKRKESSGRRHPHLLKEHVIAERKRRQRLNEKLIALSALLPNLKKADKATVLEDAIRHLKKLQERIKQLEEERASATKTMESVIFVKKSHLSVDDDDSRSSYLSADEDSDGRICRQTLPLIEARVSNNDLLIRIHCEKSKGCVGKILNTMEKLGLHVVNSFTLPFGNSTFDITILAKMDNNLYRPLKDVVKNIRSAIVE